jgi:hypothetical protein
VLLITHPLLVPGSWKSRAIPLPTLWAITGPVTGSLYIYIYHTLHIYKHTLQNVFLVHTLLVECLLDFNIQTSKNMFVSICFLADIYTGKFYINIPEPQYYIFNKTMCMQTVHVTANTATV